MEECSNQLWKGWRQISSLLFELYHQIFHVQLIIHRLMCLIVEPFFFFCLWKKNSIHCFFSTFICYQPQFSVIFDEFFHSKEMIFFFERSTMTCHFGALFKKNRNGFFSKIFFFSGTSNIIIKFFFILNDNHGACVNFFKNRNVPKKNIFEKNIEWKKNKLLKCFAIVISW